MHCFVIPTTTTTHWNSVVYHTLLSKVSLKRYMSSLGIAISVCIVYFGLRQVVIVKFALYKAATLAWLCHEFMKPISSVILCV